MHKNGAKIVKRFSDATLAQRYFLLLMSAEDINLLNSIDLKLTGIAKGVGIEFKNDNSNRRSSNNFRERMKERQRHNKERLKNG